MAIQTTRSDAQPGARHVELGTVAIVGCPNVGKSVLFTRLTGAYAVVSNYPGTTVEVTRGTLRLPEGALQIVDTPGMYSLQPISEEEAVARRLLLDERPACVLHVVDAKNLPRMLPMTLQLLEAGLPLVLALNLMDEADAQGFGFDVEALSRELGIPVVATVGAEGRGVVELKGILARERPCEHDRAGLVYSPVIEDAITQVGTIADALVALSPRATAVLLLQGDRELFDLLRARISPEAADAVASIARTTEAKLGESLALAITMQRQDAANAIISRVMRAPERPAAARLEWLSRLLMHPLAGLPVLLAVLYFGIYQFVGRFGGGVVVDFLEDTLFGAWVNPHLTAWVSRLLPPLWSSLFVGEYGLITLGITYAIAIVLPIVGLFFLAFAILEDSGYLPRLAMLIDRLFKGIGLNGRAVIPFVLGFGCDTMATLVTRVLETRRERIIATFLLALAVPCAAQSGLFLAMLGAVQPYGLLIYVVILAGIFLLTGFLAARVVPGKRADFYIELPPLRLPRLGNVLVKTYTRLEWYFVEVLPTFLLASAVLWLGSLYWDGHSIAFAAHQGIFGWLERGLDPLAWLIGLPTSVDVAANPKLEFSGGAILLGGFFRRDFGAAGLWHLFRDGLLSPAQVLTAAVTLTLFLPCVAQFLVMKKERGLKTALTMAGIVLVIAFGVGFLLRLGLQASGLHLVLNAGAVTH
jgi:ferrous iron transport protein B